MPPRSRNRAAAQPPPESQCANEPCLREHAADTVGAENLPVNTAAVARDAVVLDNDTTDATPEIAHAIPPDPRTAAFLDKLVEIELSRRNNPCPANQ